MALEASLAELHAEALCPVCQDFLKEPVTLGCGHNCCAPCLQQHWKHLQDVLPCPVCLHPCRHWQPQKNTQLGHVADVVQQILCMRAKKREEVQEEEKEEEEDRGHCERHQHVLSLFCEDDLELLCGQCAASPDHKAHVLTPITQAAAHHKEKLKSCLGHLGKQLEEAESALARQESEKRALKEKVQRQRHQLDSETEHFKYHLQFALEAIDLGAYSEMGFITDDLRKSQMDLSDYGATLGSLLRDATRQSLQTDLGLLLQEQQVRQLGSRVESLQLPAVYSTRIPKEILAVPPHYMGLHNLITKFQEHVTFDPQTAHPSLDISPDGRTVTFPLETRPCPSASHPRAFTSYTAVLGSQGFDSGRHFWQVEIRGTGVWSIGVCKESFPRNLLMSQCEDSECWAFGMYVSQEPQGTPSHIGVFLDMELGQISFYSLRSRAHLHTITTPFPEKLWPYFFVSRRALNFSVTLL